MELQEGYWSCSKMGGRLARGRMGGLEVIQEVIQNNPALQHCSEGGQAKKSSERRDPVTSQLGLGSEEVQGDVQNR